MKALWFLVLLSGCCPPPAQPPVVAICYELYCSPKGGCTDAIVRAIDAAMKSVRVQAYQLTSEPIGNALIAASARGVDVQVLVDRSQETERSRSRAPSLIKAGLVVKTDSAHALAHNKVIVIDDLIVITGSFNFTTEAEKYAENLLVIRDKALAEKYAQNWLEHFGHAREYKKKRSY